MLVIRAIIAEMLAGKNAIPAKLKYVGSVSNEIIIISCFLVDFRLALKNINKVRNVRQNINFQTDTSYYRD